MKKNKKFNLLLILPLYIFTVFFVAGPLIYMFLLSFASQREGYGVDWIFTLNNFRKLFTPLYLSTFGQSLELALFSTLVICLIGYPFGYFMARMGERARKLATFYLMLPFGLNSLIRLYGWVIIFQKKGILNLILLRLGLIKKPLSILYSYPAIIIGMVYVLLPFMILSVYSSAEKLDWSLVEAARDLGATKTKAFLNIVFPLTLPGLFSGVILVFIPSMGLFFIADILGGNKIVLVGSLIQEQMTSAGNWPFAAALAVVLLLLTTVMLYIYRRLFQRKEAAI